MIELTVAYLVGAISWGTVMYFLRELKELRAKLVDYSAKEAEPFITRDPTLFANEGIAGSQPGSVIVTPKTPQRIEWEEAQELERKLGMRK